MRKPSTLKKGWLLAVLSAAVAGTGPAGAADAPQVIDVGSRRELFCDGLLVDGSRTTAKRTLHQPERADTVMTLDAPWEGSSCSYGCLLRVDDGYVAYYVASSTDPKTKTAKCVRICYATSGDGLHWTKPKLGRSTFNGNRDNNILLGDEFCTRMDNFMVFFDENPDCPAAERYKMLLEYSPTNGEEDKGLWLMTSPNTTDFRLSHEIVHRDPWGEAKEKGGVLIDTQNVAFWDARQKLYHLYVRGYHRRYDDRFGDTCIRDVRHATSKDFRSWSKLEFLDFGPEAEDYPLYTNVVQPYRRAPHVLVGFPTRYVERRTWSPSYDRLPDPEGRRERMKGNPRFGLAITDTVFMSSRDGRRFDRIDEAFITPGPEAERNWTYGDGYVYYGMMCLPARVGRDLELSFLHWERDHRRNCTRIVRYCLRQDGFVSMSAPYSGGRLVTRPLRYEGGELLLNFATSARGAIRLRIVEDLTGREIRSCEIFGDAVDRPVAFETGTVADLSGRTVRMEFELSDARVYSFKFQ